MIDNVFNQILPLVYLGALLLMSWNEKGKLKQAIGLVAQEFFERERQLRTTIYEVLSLVGIPLGEDKPSKQVPKPNIDPQILKSLDNLRQDFAKFATESLEFRSEVNKRLTKLEEEL